MTRLFKSLFFLMACSFAVQSRAAILQMEEFYNPTTNQTIILMNDCHLVLPAMDTKTSEACAKVMKALHAPLITEDYPEAILCSESPETRTKMLIPVLVEACKKQQVTVHGIEFRKLYAALTAIFASFAAEFKTYDELITISNEPGVMTTIDNLFNGAWQEAGGLFNNSIVPYVNAIAANKEDAAYVTAFDELLVAYSDNRGVVGDFMQQHEEKSFPEFMSAFFDNVYSKLEDGGFAYNTHSVWRATEDALCKLLDAHILKKLHELNHERVIFVHAGPVHLQDLANKYLPNIGFESKSKISHTEDCLDLFHKKGESGQAIRDILESQDFEQYCIDIDTFVQQCKTLPHPYAPDSTAINNLSSATGCLTVKQ